MHRVEVYYRNQTKNVVYYCFFVLQKADKKCCVLHLQVPYTTFTLQNLGGKRLHDIYITKFGEKTSGAGAGQKYSGQTYSSSHFPE